MAARQPTFVDLSTGVECDRFRGVPLAKWNSHDVHQLSLMGITRTLAGRSSQFFPSLVSRWGRDRTSPNSAVEYQLGLSKRRIEKFHQKPCHPARVRQH